MYNFCLLDRMDSDIVFHGQVMVHYWYVGSYFLPKMYNFCLQRMDRAIVFHGQVMIHYWYVGTKNYAYLAVNKIYNLCWERKTNILKWIVRQNVCLTLDLTSSHRMPYKFAFYFGTAIFVCFGWELCQHVTRGVPLGGLPCIHASVSWSPWGHGSVDPDKRHCHQITSSLFRGFLPNPFIQDLFHWRTSQELVKTDLYPLSLIYVRYTICSTGCWSILGRCFGACQRSNCAEERRP